MPMYSWTAVVEGSTIFPVDMLRYDCCYPARQEDVETIILGYDAHLGSGKPALEQVYCRTDKGQASPFHENRWLSFGWKIISERRV